jgi:hypothetical protein
MDEKFAQDPNDICSPNRLRLNINLPTSKTLIEDEPDIEIAVLEE